MSWSAIRQAHSKGEQLPPRDVRKMTPSDVRAWVHKDVFEGDQSLNAFFENIEKNGVGGLVVLAGLSDTNMKELGLPNSIYQDRLKVAIKILQLQQKRYDASPSPPEEEPEELKLPTDLASAAQPENVKSWDRDATIKWLKSTFPSDNNLAKSFQSHMIDGSLLLKLTPLQLKELGVSSDMMLKNLRLQILLLQESQTKYDNKPNVPIISSNRLAFGTGVSPADDGDAENVLSWTSIQVQDWLKKQVFPSADEQTKKIIDAFARNQISGVMLLSGLTENDIKTTLAPEATSLQLTVLEINVSRLRGKQQAWDNRRKKGTIAVEAEEQEVKQYVDSQMKDWVGSADNVRGWSRARVAEFLKSQFPNLDVSAFADLDGGVLLTLTLAHLRDLKIEKPLIRRNFMFALACLNRAQEKYDKSPAAPLLSVDGRSSSGTVVIENTEEPTNVKQWTVIQVQEWLQKDVFPQPTDQHKQYIQAFVDNMLNGRAVLALNAHDLQTELIPGILPLALTILQSHIRRLIDRQQAWDNRVKKGTIAVETEEQEVKQYVDSQMKDWDGSADNVRGWSRARVAEFLKSQFPNLDVSAFADLDGGVLLTLKLAHLRDLKIEKPLIRRNFMFALACLNRAQEKYDKPPARSVSSDGRSSSGTVVIENTEEPANVKQWTVIQVQEWLQKDVFPQPTDQHKQYIQAFADNMLNGSAVLALTAHDLQTKLIPGILPLALTILQSHIRRLIDRQKAWDRIPKIDAIAAAAEEQDLKQYVDSQMKDWVGPAENVRGWSHDRVMEFLTKGFPREQILTEAFRESRADGFVLLTLTISDLREFKVERKMVKQSLLLQIAKFNAAQAKFDRDKSNDDTKEEERPEDVSSWKPAAVQDWLIKTVWPDPTELQRRFISSFEENAVDGLQLLSLTPFLISSELDIKQPLQQRMLLRHVEKLACQQRAFKNKQEDEEKQKATKVAELRDAKDRYLEYFKLQAEYNSHLQQNPTYKPSGPLSEWSDLDVFYWLKHADAGHESTIERFRYLVGHRRLKGSDLLEISVEDNSNSQRFPKKEEFFKYCIKLSQELNQPALQKSLPDFQRAVRKLIEKINMTLEHEKDPNRLGVPEIKEHQIKYEAKLRRHDGFGQPQDAKAAEGSFKEVQLCSYKGRPVAVCRLKKTATAAQNTGPAAQRTAAQRTAGAGGIPTDPETRQALLDLQREALFLYKAQGPGVVTLLGRCWQPMQGQRPFFVTEFLKGGSVWQELQRGRDGSDDTSIFSSKYPANDHNSDGVFKQQVRVADIVAQSLARLHKAGILHLDIAARNILLDSKKRPKIIDFGRSLLIKDAKRIYEWRKKIRETYSVADAAQQEEKEIAKNPTSADARLLRQIIDDAKKPPVRWLPYHVLQDNPLFTEEVDTYAFGMFMYELAARDIPYPRIPTNEEVILHKASFQGDDKSGELDVIVSVEYSQIMRACWAGAKMQTISERLTKYHQELCSSEGTRSSVQAPEFQTWQNRGSANPYENLDPTGMASSNAGVGGSSVAADGSEAGPKRSQVPRKSSNTPYMQVDSNVFFNFKNPLFNVEITFDLDQKLWEEKGETVENLTQFIASYESSRNHSNIVALMKIISLEDSGASVSIFGLCLKTLGRLASDLHSNVDNSIADIVNCIRETLAFAKAFSTESREILVGQSLFALGELLSHHGADGCSAEWERPVADLAVDALDKFTNNFELMTSACKTLNALLRTLVLEGPGALSMRSYLHSRKVLNLVMNAIERSSETNSKFLVTAIGTISRFSATFLISDPSLAIFDRLMKLLCRVCDVHIDNDDHQVEKFVLTDNSVQRDDEHQFSGDYSGYDTLEVLKQKLQVISHLCAGLHAACLDCDDLDDIKKLFKPMQHYHIKLLLSLLNSFDEEWVTRDCVRDLFRIQDGVLGILRFAVVAEADSLKGADLRIKYLCQLDPGFNLLLAALEKFPDVDARGMLAGLRLLAVRAGPADFQGKTSKTNANMTSMTSNNTYVPDNPDFPDEDRAKELALEADRYAQLDDDEDSKLSKITPRDIARLQQSVAVIMGLSCRMVDNVQAKLGKTEAVLYVLNAVIKFPSEVALVQSNLVSLAHICRSSLSNSRRLVSRKIVRQLEILFVNDVKRNEGQSTPAVVDGILQLLVALLQPDTQMLAALDKVDTDCEAQSEHFWRQQRALHLKEHVSFTVATQVIDAKREHHWHELCNLCCAAAANRQMDHAQIVADFLQLLTGLSFWYPEKLNTWMTEGQFWDYNRAVAQNQAIRLFVGSLNFMKEVILQGREKEKTWVESLPKKQNPLSAAQNKLEKDVNDLLARQHDAAVAGHKLAKAQVQDDSFVANVMNFALLCVRAYSWPKVEILDKLNYAACVHAAALPLLIALCYRDIPHNFKLGNRIPQSPSVESMRVRLMCYDVLQLCINSVRYALKYLEFHPQRLSILRNSLWLIILFLCEEDNRAEFTEEGHILSEVQTELQTKNISDILTKFEKSRSIQCLCFILLVRMNKVDNNLSELALQDQLRRRAQVAITMRPDEFLDASDEGYDMFTMGSFHKFGDLAAHASAVLRILDSQAIAERRGRPYDISVISADLKKNFGDTSGPCGAFEIEVNWTNGPDHTWRNVWRRFTSFEVLHRSLLQNGIYSVPELAVSWQHISDEAALQKRRQALETWLKATAALPAVQNNVTFQAFCGSRSSENSPKVDRLLAISVLYPYTFGEQDPTVQPSTAALMNWSAYCVWCDPSEDRVVVALGKVSGGSLISSRRRKETMIAQWKSSKLIDKMIIADCAGLPTHMCVLRRDFSTLLAVIAIDDGSVRCVSLNPQIMAVGFLQRWDIAKSVPALATMLRTDANIAQPLICFVGKDGVVKTASCKTDKLEPAGQDLDVATSMPFPGATAKAFAFHSREQLIFVGTDKSRIYIGPLPGSGPRRDNMPVLGPFVLNRNEMQSVRCMLYVEHMRCLLLCLGRSLWAVHFKDWATHHAVLEVDMHLRMEQLALPFFEKQNTSCMLFLCNQEGPLWNFHRQGVDDLSSAQAERGDPAVDISYLVTGSEEGILQLYRLPNKVLTNVLKRNRLKAGQISSSSYSAAPPGASPADFINNDYVSGVHRMELVTSKALWKDKSAELQLLDKKDPIKKDPAGIKSLVWNAVNRSVLVADGDGAIKSVNLADFVPPGFISPQELHSFATVDAKFEDSAQQQQQQQQQQQKERQQQSQQQQLQKQKQQQQDQQQRSQQQSLLASAPLRWGKDRMGSQPAFSPMLAGSGPGGLDPLVESDRESFDDEKHVGNTPGFGDEDSPRASPPAIVAPKDLLHDYEDVEDSPPATRDDSTRN